jgi:hypothetical protein
MHLCYNNSYQALSMIKLIQQICCMQNICDGNVTDLHEQLFRSNTVAVFSFLSGQISYALRVKYFNCLSLIRPFFSLEKEWPYITVFCNSSI